MAKIQIKKFENGGIWVGKERRYEFYTTDIKSFSAVRASFDWTPMNYSDAPMPVKLRGEINSPSISMERVDYSIRALTMARRLLKKAPLGEIRYAHTEALCEYEDQITANVPNDCTCASIKKWRAENFVGAKNTAKNVVEMTLKKNDHDMGRLGRIRSMTAVDKEMGFYTYYNVCMPWNKRYSETKFDTVNEAFKYLLAQQTSEAYAEEFISVRGCPITASKLS